MIDLQPATPDDRKAVLELVRAYFAFDDLDYTPAVEAGVDDLLANPAYGRLLLARQGGAVVGYAALTYGFDHEAGGRIGVVTDLYLVESARGRGLGSSLLDGVLSHARADRLRRVELWVIDGNERARRLYDSVGFEPIEGRRAMVRELSPPVERRVAPRPFSAVSGTVRPATPEDVPAAMAAVMATGMLPTEAVEEVAALMVAHLEGGLPGDALWLVVDEGDGPTGVAYCAPERMASNVWNTLMIAIRPDRQGRGLGAALMSGVEQRAIVGGGRLLLVETSGTKGFAAARRFYRSLGYEQGARIRDFYDPGDDKIVFCKRLPDLG